MPLNAVEVARQYEQEQEAEAARLEAAERTAAAVERLAQLAVPIRWLTRKEIRPDRTMQDNRRHALVDVRVLQALVHGRWVDVPEVRED